MSGDELDIDEPGPDDADEGPEGEERVRCWCGAVGSFDELFSDDPYLDSCAGTGHLECRCGGDQCVCHWHGQEVECPGCDDCRREGDFEDGPDDFHENRDFGESDQTEVMP